MRHCLLFGPYFMPFFNGQFLKCDILPVSNDPMFSLKLDQSFIMAPTTLSSMLAGSSDLKLGLNNHHMF